jgi:hypothetical protein
MDEEVADRNGLTGEGFSSNFVIRRERRGGVLCPSSRDSNAFSRS